METERWMETGEEQVGKKHLALGPPFWGAGNEVSHLLRTKLQGMGGNQNNNKSKLYQSTLRDQLRLSAESAMLSSPERGSKK